MKRFGIILLGIILWAGAFAQNQQQTVKTDTALATSVSGDSLKSLYMNKDLDPKEAILLQKLTPQQILELEKQRVEQKKFNDMPLPPWAIVLICIAPFIMVILIVFFSVKARKEREKSRHDLYLKSMELGQPLPEKFFEEPEKKSSNLKKGVIWLAVGLAVVLGFLIINETDGLFLGIIPAFVGAAYLIVYFIEDRNKKGLNE